MPNIRICCIAASEAVRHASIYLSQAGFEVTDQPSSDVTHLLLPVPSFASGNEYLYPILKALSQNVTIVGGNLDAVPEGYRTIDLLQDPYYLARNAAITAQCAMKLIGRGLQGLPVLILGWGRIGKCLGKFLTEAGAEVTIAARRNTDLALLQALGYRCVPIDSLQGNPLPYKAILNTVPAMILPDPKVKDCVVLELASKPGVSGRGIISARGLPGKYAPEESGRLIVETMIRLTLNKEDN
ncbi:MAG: hypothetical protein IJ422_03160 [Oscillospiraceae bacterium]|nr:hypothetical protein [Oscillospiraceae bacterium]MBQ9149127.1 hypothetical protein [Oscillospiraceae bacterium]